MTIKTRETKGLTQKILSDNLSFNPIPKAGGIVRPGVVLLAQMAAQLGRPFCSCWKRTNAPTGTEWTRMNYGSGN